MADWLRRTSNRRAAAALGLLLIAAAWTRPDAAAAGPDGDGAGVGRAGAEPLASEISVLALNSFLEGAPGQTVTLLWEVHNRGTDAAWLTPEAVVPPGWLLLLPPDPLMLEAGDRTLQTMLLLIGYEALPGTYEASIAYRSSDTRERQVRASVGRSSGPIAASAFAVEVTEVRSVEIRFVDVPRTVFSADYKTTAHVYNRGNVEERLRLILEADDGAVVSLFPREVRLQPGQFAFVEATVEGVRRTGRTRTQRLRLAAEAAGVREPQQTPLPLAETFAFVRLEQPWTELDVAAPTFPLELFIGIGASDQGRPGWTWSLSGSGRLAPAAGPTVEIDVGSTHGRLSVVDTGRRVTVGHQRFSASPWTEPGREGIGFQAELEGDIVRGRLFAFEHGPGGDPGGGGLWKYGGSASFRLAEVAEVSLVHVTGADKGWAGSLMSVIPRLELGGLQVRAEVARQLGGSSSGPAMPAAPPQALRLEADWRRSGSTWGLELAFKDEGYKGAARDESRWKIVRTASVFDRGLVGIAAQGRRGGSGGGSWQGAELLLAGSRPSFHWLVRMVPYRWEVDADTERPGYVFDLALNRFTAPGRIFTLSFSRRETLQDFPGQRRRTDVYGFTWRFPVPGGFVAPYVKVWKGGVGWTDGPPKAGLGARLDLVKGPWRLHLAGDVTDVSQAVPRIRADIRFELPEGATLETRARVTPGSGDVQPTTYDVRMGFTVPMSLPVTSGEQWAELRGRVTDGDGLPVAGAAVEVDGRIAVTDSEGYYHIPRIGPSVRPLALRASEQVQGLGSDYVPHPTVPAAVDLRPGQAAVVDLRLLRTATVRGSIVVERPGSVLDTGRVSATVEPNAVGPLMIVLESETVALRQMVGPGADHFIFDGLPPGRWRLGVYADGLADRYEAAISPSVLEAAPGEQLDVLVELRPVLRSVHVLEGGAVTVRLPGDTAD